MLAHPSLLQDEFVRFDLVEAPDPAAAAAAALAGALDYAARMTHEPGGQAVLEQIQQGDATAYGYFRYALAGQVGSYLGSLDDEIWAVYLFGDEATPEDAIFGATAGLPYLHLLVRTHRKTEALSALVASLDHALATHYAERNGAEPRIILDVQAVDDWDAAGNSGLGALVKSLYRPPLKVWER